MYVAVLHEFQDPPTAFARGEKLVMNEDAPAGVRGLQFYPSTDGARAACLWESESVDAVREYVDSTLGDSSVNTCWEGRRRSGVRRAAPRAAHAGGDPRLALMVPRWRPSITREPAERRGRRR